MNKHRVIFPVVGLLVVLALASVSTLSALVQAKTGVVQAQTGAPGSPDAITATGQLRISAMGADGNTDFAGFNSDIAYNSATGEYLVVWAGDDNTGSLVDGEVEIYGQRVNASDGSLLASRFRVSNMGADGDASRSAQRPAIAYNDANQKFLVVWHGDDATDDENEIYGQFLDNSGSGLGSDFVISAMGPASDPEYDAFNAEVVYGSASNQFLVIWQADDNSGSLVDDETEIYGAILNADTGAVVVAAFRISTMGPDGDANYDATNPAVAYDAGNDRYLVVWSADSNAGSLVDDEFEIYGHRISNAGASVGGQFRISTMASDGDPAYDATRPAVAYRPTSGFFQIVWSGDDNSGGLVDDELEIYSRRVDFGGSLIGSQERISNMGTDGDAAIDALDPGIVYAPQTDQFQVVWRADLADNDLEIFGQYLKGVDGSLDGSLSQISQMGGTIGDTHYGADRPALAYDSLSRTALVVWHGDDDTAPLVDNEFEVFGYRWPAGQLYFHFIPLVIKN